MRTEREIKSDFVQLVKDTGLADAVSGGVYPEGERPRGSTAEDITVMLKTADGRGLLQSGKVTIKAFVVNKPHGKAQVVGTDSRRVAELEAAFRDWAERIKGVHGDFVVNPSTDDYVGSDSVQLPSVQRYVFITLIFTYLTD